MGEEPLRLCSWLCPSQASSLVFVVSHSGFQLVSEDNARPWGRGAPCPHPPPAPAPSSLSLHPASSPLLAPPEKTDRLSRRCALPALNMMLSYSAKSLGSRSEGAALGFTSWGRVSPKDSGRAGALNILMDRVHPRTEEAGAQDQGHACRGGPCQPDIPRSLVSPVRPRDPFLSAY